LDKDKPEEVVLGKPYHYRETQNGSHLTRFTLLGWMARAFFQASIVFFVTIGSYGEWSGSSESLDYMSMSFPTFTALVCINMLTIAFESRSLTILNLVVIIGTVVSYFVMVTIASYYPDSTYMIIIQLYKDPIYWLTFILGVFMATMPVLMLQFVSLQWKSKVSKGLLDVEHGLYNKRNSGENDDASDVQVMQDQRKSPHAEVDLFLVVGTLKKSDLDSNQFGL